MDYSQAAAEVLADFPNAEEATRFLEKQRWPDGVVCPSCGEKQRIGVRKGGFYRCNACLFDFTVRTGTILERSKVPLHKWLVALHIFVSRGGRVNSVKLAKQLSVTQKSAWLMLKRLRSAFVSPTGSASGGGEGDDPALLNGAAAGGERSGDFERRENSGRSAFWSGVAMSPAPSRQG